MDENKKTNRIKVKVRPHKKETKLDEGHLNYFDCIELSKKMFLRGYSIEMEELMQALTILKTLYAVMVEWNESSINVPPNIRYLLDLGNELVEKHLFNLRGGCKDYLSKEQLRVCKDIIEEIFPNKSEEILNGLANG
jgi:hypothetical protein